MAFCQAHHSQIIIIFWLLARCQNPDSHMPCECRVPSNRDQVEDTATASSCQSWMGATLIWVKIENAAGWMCKLKSMARCAAAFPMNGKWQVSFTKQEGSHGHDISGKRRLWLPDQYKINNTAYLKSVLPNYAFWWRAKNDIEGFRVAFTSEWIHSAWRDIKILSENLLLSSSSIPALPGLRMLLMHLPQQGHSCIPSHRTEP